MGVRVTLEGVTAVTIRQAPFQFKPGEMELALAPLTPQHGTLSSW